MPELLVELGCEELPAGAVRRAFEQLATEIASRLDVAGISHGASRSLGTPRRLIVSIADVSERQPDRYERRRGPSVKAAFLPDGSAAPPLVGFCKAQGVDPSTVALEGDYVWTDQHIPGRAAIEVLSTILPEAIMALTFEKSMRWGTSRIRFVRPIRWILASFGGKVVPFSIEHVESGLESRGRRFQSPEPFPASNLDELMRGLRDRGIEPDPLVREQMIREGAAKVASGTPMLPDSLVDENVFLTESPAALEGEFREEYLELPRPVLITAMAKHERFFPVQDASGKLLNRFVSIRNGGVDEVVREGNAWVLNARFNDAKFFFDEDLKHSMEEFLARTERIVFQEKLGSVRQRVERLVALVGQIVEETSAHGSDNTRDTELAKSAALYCKADLSCGLVSELPSLQGIIGGEYSRRENFEDPVCEAIALHYDLDRINDLSQEGQRTAMRVLMADQLDKLAGYLGLGLMPSGSGDPYGLRRAANLLIEASWKWPHRITPLGSALARAASLYGFSESVVRDANQLISARYESLLPDVRHDVLEAALMPPGDELGGLDPQGVRFRVACLGLGAKDEKFVQTATRPLNILASNAAKAEPLPANDSSWDGDGLSDTGTMLLRNVRALLPEAGEFERAGSAAKLVASLKSLAEPINTFFDTTMVMDADPAKRMANLRMLQEVCGALGVAGDWSKLVFDQSG